MCRSKGRSRLEDEQICRPSRQERRKDGEKKHNTEPVFHIPERKIVHLLTVPRHEH